MPGRAIVAEEHWYVYHAGWEKKPWYRWFTDSRQVKRFKETRILGSAHVGLVYLYVNLPAYRTPESRASLVEHFRKAHAGDLQPASDTERKERQERLANLLESLKGSLPDQDERQALESVKRAQSDRQAVSDPDVELIVQLEAQRYIKAFAAGDRTIANELALVDKDTGEELIGLSPTLATTATFASFNTLFYKVGVTSKTPAPVENFKNAGRFVIAGQSGAQTRLYVEVANAAVCAGGHMNVKHVPSDSARHRAHQERERRRRATEPAEIRQRRKETGRTSASRCRWNRAAT